MVVGCAGYSRFIISLTSHSLVMIFKGQKTSGVRVSLGSAVDSRVVGFGE